MVINIIPNIYQMHWIAVKSNRVQQRIHKISFHTTIKLYLYTLHDYLLTVTNNFIRWISWPRKSVANHKFQVPTRHHARRRIFVLTSRYL